MNRKKSKKCLYSLIFIFLMPLITAFFLNPEKLYGLELYTLIKNGCEPETGLIINTDDLNVYMLNLDGKMAVVKRSEADLILVYNIHDNPLEFLDLNSGTGKLLREVHVDDIDQTHFIGWPIRLLEKIIIFYDIEGKTHLVDIEKIESFAPPKELIFTIKETSKFKKEKFGLGGNLPQCRKEEVREEINVVEPTRMISDRIKVHNFFSVFFDGFTILKRFEKKTAFYAKPFLYDKETRLGLNYTNEDYIHELNFTFLPLYLQFSSGAPYAAQGEYLVGTKPVDLLPSVEPQFVLRADAKAHFFTATFVGNIAGLAAGSRFIVDNRFFFTEFFLKIDDDDTDIYPLFNYLTLTGVDYHEYSFSVGFYYPVFGILGNNKFREISSFSASPLLRIQRINKNYTIKAIYSQSNIGSKMPASDDNIQLIQASELSDVAMISNVSAGLLDDLANFDLNTQFLRLSLDYEITREITFGISEVLFQGDYLENLISGGSYSLDFTYLITSMTIEQDFSDYITLKGDLNYFIRNKKISVDNKTSDANENKISFVISIEFLL